MGDRLYKKMLVHGGGKPPADLVEGRLCTYIRYAIDYIYH